MADISRKIEEISAMIYRGKYFTINRARQYGKTTTLSMLRRTLSKDYLVIQISFEGLGYESFRNSEAFCKDFLSLIFMALSFTDSSVEYKDQWKSNEIKDFLQLGNHITNLCRDKKVVLMIDEVDKTSNNQIFLQFLALLRNKYLLREENRDYTFHSVILAGVYDIQNIKLKMIHEGYYLPYDQEQIYNSPWNIAAPFNVDMSFSVDEIVGMLNEYNSEHHFRIPLKQIAAEIHRFTNGYPYLVSYICKTIDEKKDRDWSLQGIQTAVRLIISLRSTLFDDIYKNLENNQDLYRLIYDILITGTSRTFSLGNTSIQFALMFGIIQQNEDCITISNQIFELIICNYFIAKDETDRGRTIIGVLQNDILSNGQFDMELCLRKFAEHYIEIFSQKSRDISFLERHGRMIFLTYLKPLLNGKGFYHIESSLTDLRRMDVIVDYASEQFIVELKLWDGKVKHEKAYEQLLSYMKSKRHQTGYLLTFDFRKSKKNNAKIKWVAIDNRHILDVMI